LEIWNHPITIGSAPCAVNRHTRAGGGFGRRSDKFAGIFYCQRINAGFNLAS
jgi:hypothetical protein